MSALDPKRTFTQPLYPFVQLSVLPDMSHNYPLRRPLRDAALSSCHEQRNQHRKRNWQRLRRDHCLICDHADQAGYGNHARAEPNRDERSNERHCLASCRMARPLLHRNDRVGRPLCLARSVPARPDWFRGATFATGAWLLMMIVLMPMAGAGLFGLHLGVRAPIATLVLHWIYGAVLGGIYGAWAHQEHAQPTHAR